MSGSQTLLFCRRISTAISRILPTNTMFRRQLGNIMNLRKPSHFHALFSTSLTYAELPRKLNKTERKPMVTSVNELKRKARLEKRQNLSTKEVLLRPPENGMLVQSLIPTAHQVLAARSQLLPCISKVLASTTLYSCSVCGEVHVGHTPHKIKTCNVIGSQKSKEHVWEIGSIEHIMPVVESFHLYDRIGRAVTHNERLLVDRIPAIVELCIQAGVDIAEFPVRRRDFPVYSVAGKLMDFEKRFPNNNSSVKEVNTFGFWETKQKSIQDNKSPNLLNHDDIQGFAVKGMEAWENMRTGAMKLMEKYGVQTCGYCTEVQVGPKGHRVRQCYAYKHQMRYGQHAWQEATFDDLVPPVYVWHLKDPQSRDPLLDNFKRYYGKLPAVVEMFAQAGARVGDGYAQIMRDDISVPELDKEKLVV